MRFMRLFVAALSVLALFQPALSQTQDNLDLGSVVTGLQLGGYTAAGTYNSPDILNSDSKGVTCLYDQLSSSGSPSVTFSIQSKDASSGIYDALITSSAISNGANTYLSVYPGIAVSSLPSDWSAQSLKLPRLFRIQVVVGGSTSPGVNAQVGCNLLN